jgi:hypothetical protein
MLASRRAPLARALRRCPDERAPDVAVRWRDMRHLVMAVVLAVVCSACAADVAQEAAADATADAVSALDDGIGSLDSENMTPAEPVEPVASTADAMENPAELQICLNACKAGGQTIIFYCGTMPTPQFRALCYIAAAGGTVSCMGFCYARFVD